MAEIQALSSQKEVLSRHLSTELQQCEDKKKDAITMATRELELKQKAHDDQVHSVWRHIIFFLLIVDCSCLKLMYNLLGGEITDWAKSTERAEETPRGEGGPERQRDSGSADEAVEQQGTSACMQSKWPKEIGSNHQDYDRKDWSEE